MKVFDKLAEDVSAKILLEDGLHNADKHSRIRVFKEIIKLLGSPVDFKNKKLLDVGGGPAYYSTKMANYISHSVNLDFSASMLKRGRERCSGLNIPVELIRADAENLPFLNNAFDYVMALDTLHHVPDWKKCLSDMNRVASEKIIILEPNAASLPHILNEIILFYRPTIKGWKIIGEWKVCELHHITPWQMGIELRESGLKDIRINVMRFIPQFWRIPNFLLKFLIPIERILEKVPIVKFTAGSFLACGKKA